MIPTHCPICGSSIVSLIGGSAELHGCPVDEPGHFFAKVEKEAAQPNSFIPETLPITERAVCFNGGLKDGCGETVEFKDGVALCPRCSVYQQYVEAADEFTQSVMGAGARLLNFTAKA